MAPDTLQNLIISIRLLFAHNFLMITFSLFFVYAFIACYRNPNRASLLMMMGSLLLLFYLEYQKHIKLPLLEQTRDSLITARYSVRIDIFVARLINKIIPAILFSTGSILFITSFFYQKLESKFKQYWTKNFSFDN